MIVDRLENASQYFKLFDRLTTGLRFLQRDDLAAMEKGKYEIEGDHVYAMVQEYPTRDRSKGIWEAHRKYYDIQYVISGIEYIGYTHIDTIKVTKPYDASIDALLGEGDGTMVLVPPGSFVILAPHDAHMPGQTYQQTTNVKKVVVKVEVPS